MGGRPTDGEKYLQMYPDLVRWINICVACQFKGYKPQMPENDNPKFMGQNLRRYFQPLALGTDGLCVQCQRALRR